MGNATSPDGVNWTTVKTGSSIQSVTNGLGVLRLYLPTAVTTQYLRVRLAQEDEYTIIVPEIEVYDQTSPTWATITGTVTDATSGSGIPAQNEINSPEVTPNWADLYDIDTNPNGTYTLLVDF